LSGIKLGTLIRLGLKFSCSPCDES
jgi:hypothetical protein